jgi:hypothetical protein
MVWPILISVSLAPGPYFFWAKAAVGSAAAAAAAKGASTMERRLVWVMRVSCG